jgi:hypothetical protein
LAPFRVLAWPAHLVSFSFFIKCFWL